MNYQVTLTWQQILFADNLKRHEILKLRADWPCLPITLRVHRNQGFEQVSSILPSFLAFGGWQANILFGDYDDTLSFSVVTSEQPAVDIELVWLDFDRYSGAGMTEDQLDAWLLDRLAALRAKTAAGIIVANRAGSTNGALAHWAIATPSVAILDQAALATSLGDAYWDTRLTKLTGTRLSDRACLLTARNLGCGIMPVMLGPSLKVVAIDLDNTLYRGVLGEDGIQGVELTPGHKVLQELVVSLTRRGLLLVVVSRNEPEDVEALFRERTDFPLQAVHVTDWQVGWDSKALSIRRTLEKLRVGLDSVLFIDDNLGELTAVAQELPTVKLVFAGHSPEQTAAVLRSYPALWPKTHSAASNLRADDLKANIQRQEATAAMDAAEYLRSLAVEMTFALNPVTERMRLAEMSSKTNQFNLALRRFGEVAVDEYLTDPARGVVMVWLKDRLADSGSVAAIFVRKDGDTLVVDELCISCRALGRYVEDIIVAEALAGVQAIYQSQFIQFSYAIGPRNQPARQWLAAFIGHDLLDNNDHVNIEWPKVHVDNVRNENFVKTFWRNG